METLNYAKSVTLNFNLRKPRSKKPTNIYAVVKMSGKQIKIPTNAKICSYLWNNKKQLPVLSESMSEIDKNNALKVSNIIFSFRRVFADFYLYLCSRQEVVTAIEVKDYFMENVLSEFKVNVDMAKNGVPNVKHEKKATKALKKALELYPTIKSKIVAESTLNTYKYNLSNFVKYCEDIKRDSILMLTEKGINNYEIYLRSHKKSAGNIRDSLRIVKILINEVIVKHPYFKTYGIKTVSVKLPTNVRSEGKMVELTEDEIKSLADCKGLTPKQQEYRDLFVLECLTGQRASDIPILFDSERYTIKDDYFSFITKKEGVPALVKRTPEVLAVISRYKDGFRHINISSKSLTQNESTDLKLIAKKAGLNRMLSYKDNHGKILTKPLCEIISSHHGRHTFVTKMARVVPLETLKFLTGHKDTQALKKYYLHQTDEDRINLVNEALNGEQHKEATMKVSKNDLLNELFAYDSFISIIALSSNNNDVFHLCSTKRAMEVIKDISKLNGFPNDSDVSIVTNIEQVVFELSYYFRDALLYSVFKHKEHYFGMEVDVPSTEEVEAMFVLEDNDRPKRWKEIQLEEWENREK